MLRAINHLNVPPNPAYSQAISVDSARNMLFISGQVGVAADGSVPEDVGEQAKLAIGSLYALLDQAGMNSGNLVKVTIYLTDAAHLPAFVAAGAGTLPSPPPATTLFIVTALAVARLHVEIAGIAVS